MRSRVIPGSSVTIERREPVSRLKIVDLPTLGRPTITTEGSFSVIIFCREDTTNPKREARNHLVYPTSRGNRSFHQYWQQANSLLLCSAMANIVTSHYCFIFKESDHA